MTGFSSGEALLVSPFAALGWYAAAVFLVWGPARSPGVWAFIVLGFETTFAAAAAWGVDWRVADGEPTARGVVILVGGSAATLLGYVLAASWETMLSIRRSDARAADPELRALQADAFGEEYSARLAELNAVLYRRSALERATTVLLLAAMVAGWVAIARTPTGQTCAAPVLLAGAAVALGGYALRLVLGACAGRSVREMVSDFGSQMG